jgi:hypothetical protein
MVQYCIIGVFKEKGGIIFKVAEIFPKFMKNIKLQNQKRSMNTQTYQKLNQGTQ